MPSAASCTVGLAPCGAQTARPAGVDGRGPGAGPPRRAPRPPGQRAEGPDPGREVCVQAAAPRALTLSKCDTVVGDKTGKDFTEVSF